MATVAACVVSVVTSGMLQALRVDQNCVTTSADSLSFSVDEAADDTSVDIPGVDCGDGLVLSGSEAVETTRLTVEFSAGLPLVPTPGSNELWISEGMLSAFFF